MSLTHRVRPAIFHRISTSIFYLQVPTNIFHAYINREPAIDKLIELYSLAFVYSWPALEVTQLFYHRSNITPKKNGVWWAPRFSIPPNRRRTLRFLPYKDCLRSRHSWYHWFPQHIQSRTLGLARYCYCHIINHLPLQFFIFFSGSLLYPLERVSFNLSAVNLSWGMLWSCSWTISCSDFMYRIVSCMRSSVDTYFLSQNVHCSTLSMHKKYCWPGLRLINTGLSKIGEREWYFLVHRESVLGRPRRTTEKGYWKATGSDRPIRCLMDPKRLLGHRKTMVFYRGRAPRGSKTDWVMNEYRLPSNCYLSKVLLRTFT